MARRILWIALVCALLGASKAAADSFNPIIPEHSTLMLLGIGLLVLVSFRKRESS